MDTSLTDQNFTSLIEQGQQLTDIHTGLVALGAALGVKVAAFDTPQRTLADLGNLTAVAEERRVELAELYRATLGLDRLADTLAVFNVTRTCPVDPKSVANLIAAIQKRIDDESSLLPGRDS